MFYLLYNKIFKNHHSQHPHPERPERMDAIGKAVNQLLHSEQGKIINPIRATIDELCSVHSKEYIFNVLQILEKPHGFLDPDTFFSNQTKETALLSAGGCTEMIKKVHYNPKYKGFAFPRPPGHHAMPNSAGGFCIFNNIAIGAAALIKNQLASKIAIVDWDVHHGNGTQAAFYDRSDVLFISIHQCPHYPGTGLVEEIGEKKGKGFTVNIPFPPGMSDSDYQAAFSRIIIPLLNRFEPEHILVSAGFDAHKNDYLSSMNLTNSGFNYMACTLARLAHEHCEGRLSLILEGGYNLDILEECTWEVCLSILNCHKINDWSFKSKLSAQADSVINSVLKKISPYWKGL
jgi:acetoin utilization deacetylase AcuC-like enzyme